MFFAALAAIAWAGCDRQAPDPEAPDPEVPASAAVSEAAAGSRGWTPIASWSGRGIRQSETFTMLRHEWRVRWEAKAEANAPAPALLVSVHSADSGRVLAVPVDHEGSGSGVVEVVEEPRQFYLTFEGTGVEWSVTVEEARDGAPAEESR